MHGLVDSLRFKRHGDGCSLVGPSVVKIAVDQDSDRDEMRGSVREQLQQAESARSLGSFLARRRELRKNGLGQERSQRRQDDGQARFAI